MTEGRSEGQKNSKNIFQHHFLEGKFFHVVGGAERDRVEFRVIENMRFQEHGRGNVERVANFRKVGEKGRIGERFFLFVNVLFDDTVVGIDLCPDTKHNFIIRKFCKKANVFDKQHKISYNHG